jgi:predicted  nucleic acid-binding Zn-ribbon protein
LSATAALNRRLSARISGLESERNGLGRQIQAKTNELERLGKASAERTTALKREIAALETQRSESSSQIQRLSGQRLQLQNRIETLGTERSQLEQKAQSAQAATETALLRQRSLETTVANLEAGRNKLEAQQTQLEAQRNQLQAERNQLQTERNQLSASVAQLENQSLVLRNERSKLQSDIAELNQTRTSLEASVNRLEVQNNNLTQQLNAAEAQLRESQEALAEATSGNFIFRQGDLVSQLLLESNSAETLREQLQKFIKQAAQVAQVRGATRSKAVVVKPSPDLEPYIAQAQKTKGADLVLMRTLRSVTQTGLEMPVTLEVRSNDALFGSGQPIRARELVIAPRLNSSLKVTLENLLRETERDLIERGVPRENIPSPLVPAVEVTTFLSQLESVSGSVWLAVAARRDVTPAGPVQVYLSLMR